MATWVAISGTWRVTTPTLASDVAQAVQDIYRADKNLIVGGALGVDSIAIGSMFALDAEASRIKIYLPTTLFQYVGRLTAWAQGQDDVHKERVTKHIALLEHVRNANSEALVHGPDIEAHKIEETDYLAMNDRIIAGANELIAFQVNGSSGTQDAIDKARAKGIPVTVHSYSI